MDHSEIDHETQRIRQEAAKLLMEGQLLKKAAELCLQYKVEAMTEWPGEAWEALIEFGIRLGYSRDDILRIFAEGMRRNLQRATP